MKNKLSYILILLMSASIFSCKDDEVVSSDGYSSDREFMTMFRKDDNTGKGDSDPYRCQAVNLNDIQLYWYGVKDCAGYEVKMALQPNVSSGLAQDWENPDNILFDTIVGPDVTDLLIKDLQYSTDYRFAIRTLSKKGEAYHSKWYGYGNGRQWADYLGITTGDRYNVPEVIVVNQVTKTTFRINIDRAYATSGDDGTFKTNFEVDENGNFVMHVITIEASPTNPQATVPEKWQKYSLTSADFQRGYIDIDGLQENSVYVINAENKNIPVRWDAIYNTCVIRMDGDPGDPILIKHFCDPNDTIAGATTYNASRLDTILSNYNSDASLAEGTIFELEGGKTYYLANNVSLCKGLTLRTKAGTGRAKVLMNGMSTVNGAAQTMNFMFGRQPQSGELGGINIKSLIFEDIDFDCPLAKNYGDGSVTGNYFINMYSNGMAVTLQSFELKNCTFQRMIRGFVRVQGTNRKNFEKFIVENCLFYNCGYYDNNGRGYAWIAGDGTPGTGKSNIYANMIFRNNTFYDSPRTCFFTDNGKNLPWPSNIQYNITLENNTFVNYSTRSSGRKIFDLRYLPGGSKITVKKNLFILTKKDGDARNLYMEGMDIRQVNGSGEITFDVAQNYSTNTNLTSGNIFSASAFSASKNSAGFWSDYNLSGKAELEVHLGQNGISPTDLMTNPNPPYASPDANMHEVDNLDGLYYKNTDAVRNHEIYKLGIGDPRWAKTVMP